MMTGLVVSEGFPDLVPQRHLESFEPVLNAVESGLHPVTERVEPATQAVNPTTQAVEASVLADLEG